MPTWPRCWQKKKRSLSCLERNSKKQLPKFLAAMIRASLSNESKDIMLIHGHSRQVGPVMAIHASL